MMRNLLLPRLWPRIEGQLSGSDLNVFAAKDVEGSADARRVSAAHSAGGGPDQHAHFIKRNAAIKMALVEREAFRRS